MLQLGQQACSDQMEKCAFGGGEGVSLTGLSSVICRDTQLAAAGSTPEPEDLGNGYPAIEDPRQQVSEPGSTDLGWHYRARNSSVENRAGDPVRREGLQLKHKQLDCYFQPPSMSPSQLTLALRLAARGLFFAL